MTYVGRGLPQPSKLQKAVRWPVAISVEVSGSAFGRHTAEVRDLSRTGCLLALQCKFARSDFVMITIPSFGPFGARVIWSSGVETGLKFDRPLSLIVLELIAERHQREGDAVF